jgi:hypothetical protein
MPAILAYILRWLANVLLLPLLQRLISDGYQAVLDYFKKQKENREAKKSADKFDAVVTKPNVTREERKNAEDSFINGN